MDALPLIAIAASNAIVVLTATWRLSTMIAELRTKVDTLAKHDDSRGERDLKIAERLSAVETKVNQ